MKQLGDEYWTMFVRESGVFDGILFEQLVTRILNLHFAGRWRITKTSWDGGKDVVRLPDGDELSIKAWAECKVHRKPVSLRLISNTLVMAVVDEAQQLMLFSHSRVIDNARVHLSRFSAATGISVHVIDDELLEELILRYIDKLRPDFFPNVPQNIVFESQPGGLDLRHRVTRDVDVDPLRLADDDDTDLMRGNLTINLRALLRIQLAVRNRRHSEMAEIAVDVHGAEALRSPFELINVEKRHSSETVPAHGLALFDFYFRPTRAGSKLPLPTLSVNDKGAAEYIVQTGSVTVRNLIAPPLVGGRFEEFIYAFREKTSLHSRPVFAAISGRAGVGKSRLTTELMAVLLAKNREIHICDGADTKGGGFAAFARKLCARLYRLPDFDEVFGSAVSERGSSAVYDLLYDASIDPSHHVDDVLMLVERAIKSRPVGLIVDNVQYLDQTTIEFLAALVRRYGGTASKFVGIFVFNTDFIALNAAAGGFLDELKHRERYDSEHGLLLELGDFNENEVNLFLNHVISVDKTTFERGFTNRYPLMAEWLRKKTLPRPLDLLQTMQYLADEGALQRREGFLSVANVDLLHATLSAPAKKLREILKLRWRRILSSRPDLEEAGRSLAVLRRVRVEHAERLGLAEDDLETLILLGLVRENEHGEFAFFHEQIERCFATLYEKLDRTAAGQLAQRLVDTGLDGFYFPSYVIAAARAGTAHDALVVRASEFLGNGLPYNDLNAAFGECLRGLIRQRPAALPVVDELRAALSLALLVSTERGVAYRLKILDAEIAPLKQRFERYRSAGEQFAHILREHATWHFAANQDSRARTLLEEARDLLDRLDFDTPIARDIARADILNRLCVAYKSLADGDRALSAGLESLEIAERVGAHGLAFLDRVDLGYIFYGSQSASSELFRYWNGAVEYFGEHRETISAAASDNAACAALIQSHVLMLSGRLDEAGTIIDRHILRCMLDYDVFYAVGFMLQRVVRLFLMPDPWRRADQIADHIDQALDTIITHNVSRSYWIALHARAKVQLISGKSSAMGTYREALEQVLIGSTAGKEALSLFFFEDLALAARELREPLPPEIANIRNPLVRARMSEIARFTDTERAAYRPCSTYNDGRNNLPCP